MNNYDKIPLDTSKWSLTETLNIDFNSDGIKDVILVFDKYRELTRPDNVQTPVLFYLGVGSDDYHFVSKAEKIIYSPYYELEISEDAFIVEQKGIRDDKNIYINFYKYQDEDVVMFKEIVVQKIERLSVDDETGDVTTKVLRTDTLHNQSRSISISQYSILELMKNR